MSDYERNTGRLVPVIGSLEDLAEGLIKSIPSWADSKLEVFKEESFAYGYLEMLKY